MGRNEQNSVWKAIGDVVLWLIGWPSHVLTLFLNALR